MPLVRSVDDTRYASWPITAPAGIDVTLDTAKVGFTLQRWDTPTTWYAASIVVDAVRYGDSKPRIRVLLGTANGAVSPGKGSWHIQAKITDDPEVPLLYLDSLVLH